MNNTCFTRPKKPLTCKRPDFDIPIPIVDINAPKLLTVDRGTECHTTPDHVADLMVSYLDYEHATINAAASSVLEPHAGTGQLVAAMLRAGIMGGYINTIEKHQKLVKHMRDRFKDTFVTINQGDFLTDFDDFKHSPGDLCFGEDRIICNPPFKNIVAHMDQVFKCLKPGGLAICLVPISYKKLEHDVLEELDNNTFSYAKVNTKIIRITK
jgi:phospholipid N-methyltransferase